MPEREGGGGGEYCSCTLHGNGYLYRNVEKLWTVLTSFHILVMMKKGRVRISSAVLYFLP
jgi:hypothetical protein